MALKTALTELLSIQHPVVLAPMTGSSGGELAAAVSNAGGLGLIGGGGGDPELLEPEIALLVERTTKPWGIGFITWAATRELMRRRQNLPWSAGWRSCNRKITPGWRWS
jgi:nitronate monooxygenase